MVPVMLRADGDFFPNLQHKANGGHYPPLGGSDSLRHRAFFLFKSKKVYVKRCIHLIALAYVRKNLRNTIIEEAPMLDRRPMNFL